MAAPITKRILLLGGHGKVSLLMTPQFLARGWHVTSVIRNPDQKGDILAAAGKVPTDPSNLSVLVESLEDVKSEGDAKRILDQVNVDTVVWSAGAGGKGGPERTYAIDRDAAQHFISASISTPSVHTFLLVSALSIRRKRAPGWDDENWARIHKLNTEVMPDYYKAKLQADEFLTVLGDREAKKGSSFRYLILRPGGLTDVPATGKVELGKTKGYGSVSRADVAGVAAALLGKYKGSGWFDLLSGDETIEEAVARVQKDGINSIEGESLEEMAKDVNL